MNIPFCKMHGMGNDFVIVDCRDGKPSPSREVMAAMTDRRRGIGCDQLIVLLPAVNPRAGVFMRIYNYPDASEAEACGNATRCVADILMNEAGNDRAFIQTVAGLLECHRAPGGLITVDMGIPRLGWQDVPLSRACDTLELPLALHDAGKNAAGCAVNVGNPHAVFFVSDVENLDVAAQGPALERDPLFPARANIEFATVLSPGLIRMRVWERGAGITQACGSAACATIVAAVRRGLAARQAEIVMDGGSLQLEWRESDDHIMMTGPVAYVFDGVWTNKKPA